MKTCYIVMLGRAPSNGCHFPRVPFPHNALCLLTSDPSPQFLPYSSLPLCPLELPRHAQKIAPLTSPSAPSTIHLTYLEQTLPGCQCPSVSSGDHQGSQGQEVGQEPSLPLPSACEKSQLLWLMPLAFILP